MSEKTNQKAKVQQAGLLVMEMPIVKRILLKLKRELPATLSYHSFEHTLDVLHESILFGVTDNVSERQLILLGVAAAFHDAGFLKKPNPNESIGAEMARKAMRKDGSFTEEEGALVTQMILDTQPNDSDEVPPSLRTSLSGYLIDADVSNFGREDFFDKSLAYRTEVKKRKGKAFDRSLLFLLETHKWHCNAAIKLRQAQKELNIKKLKAILETK